MKTWLVWMLLSALTGSPLVAAAIVLVFYVVIDRFTLGILPDPVRWIRRWQRSGALERKLAAHPFDRKTRAELADLYLDRGRAQQAYDVLLPNHQAGDDDVHTLFSLGVAAYRAGRSDEAEKLLAQAWERDPKFRLGAIPLELGRGRLAAGKHEGAVAALLHLLEVRPSSVEGKVLLARCRLALGQKAEGEKLFDEAWRDHKASPRFAQRQQRWWAWRAKPERPIAYLFAVVVVMVALQQLVPWGSFQLPRSYQETEYDD